MQPSLPRGAPVVRPSLLCLALLGIALLPGSAAQVPLDCIECSVEVRTVAWNGTGLPGTVVGGTFELENQGNGRDTVTIHATADDDTWLVEADTDMVENVPPGSGVFASTENTETFRVNVLVPAEARAGATASVTVTVTSDTDASATASVSEAAVAGQFYGWSLDCTPAVSAEKTEKAIVVLEATNTGNGPDGAEVTSPPLAGLAVTDIRRLEAGAGETVERTVELGVGLRLDDDEYTLRWDLRSASDQTDSCTTRLTVTGGQPDPTADGDDETNDSPGPTAVLGAFVVVAALWTARRRH